MSRTVRLVHREAEGSWLALQLLLMQGVLAQQERIRPYRLMRNEQAAEPLYSPRGILLAIRQEMHGRCGRGQPSYEERLRAARGEERSRTSAKASRDWPRRKPHKPPKPPEFRTLTAAQKSLLSRLKSKAA